MKKLITCICIVLLIVCMTACNRTRSTELAPDDIFVSTGELELSEFDQWMLDNTGLSWVPSYLIFDGHQFVGLIRGCISGTEFKTELATLQQEFSKNYARISISDLPIYSAALNKQVNFVSALPKNGLNIIEIHMVGCKDCEESDGIPGTYQHPILDEQGSPTDDYTEVEIKEGDKSYTDDVREAVNANFYRYYIRSTIDDVRHK